MIIRVWQEQDLERVAQLEQECFSDPWSYDALKSSFENPLTHCFLAEDGGQVCGYCCVFCLFEDAEVLNIAVAKACRGKGYAKALLEKMHQTAKELGATQSFLEVRVSNASAIGLYERYGYESYGVRAKYYADGESAFVMKKSL